jgi:hypothetical protein
MSSLTDGIVAIGTAIVGTATLAVIVSKQANTSQVISAGGNAFATALEAAVSPVTGNMPSTNLIGGYNT